MSPSATLPHQDAQADQGSPEPAESQAASEGPQDPDRMVLAISVDGLAPAALLALGPDRLPNFWRLVGEGSSTLNARTEVEQTVTMPNHAGMFTGRRVLAAAGGHGYTADDDNGATVAVAGESSVPSIFDSVDAAGESSALFASKEKFALFDRTWGDIDRYVLNEDNAALGEAVEDDLLQSRRAFTFLHLSAPDKTGHASGWMSGPYLEAVEAVDAVLGGILGVVDGSRYLSRHLVLMLTADHGGDGVGHSARTNPNDYTIPFVVFGAGVASGADLYGLNPQLRDPGTGLPGYGGAQPVRNADVANLAADLLGLDPVAGSQVGAEAPLSVGVEPVE